MRASGGRGLRGLTERVKRLGGSLESRSLVAGFELLVRLPAIEFLQGGGDDQEQSPSRLPHDQLAAGRREAQRSLLWAWLLPVACLLLIAVGFTSYFTYVTIASVLTPEEFARIDVGDSRADTEHILPPVEMLEPPTEQVATPRDGAECSFYEGEVSFFDREQVYRVCFDDGVVISADVIPSETP